LHIFLQGMLNVGKSTVIRKTLEILTACGPLKIGGFNTWRSGALDSNIYIRPAMPGREDEKYHLASYRADSHNIDCDPLAFDQTGVRLLEENPYADLIIMDELGFLERYSSVFQQTVLKALDRDIPVIGVLRKKDIPWHEPIKTHPLVSIREVTMENRDTLPQELADRLRGRSPRN